jgi:hypothetical protein
MFGSSMRWKNISCTLFSKTVKHAPFFPISEMIIESIDVFLKIVVFGLRKEYNILSDGVLAEETGHTT